MTLPAWTVDWGHAFRANAAEWLWEFRDRPCVYLEVGVFEGASGFWMLEHVLTHPRSRYVGIDTWDGSDRLRDAYPRARENLSAFSQRVRLVRERAQACLRRGGFEPRVDVAYIDGDHRAESVAEISGLVWPRVLRGGVVVWDDLPWGEGQVGAGVDRFLASIEGECQPLFRNWQMGVRRIG